MTHGLITRQHGRRGISKSISIHIRIPGALTCYTRISIIHQSITIVIDVVTNLSSSRVHIGIGIITIFIIRYITHGLITGQH